MTAASAQAPLLSFAELHVQFAQTVAAVLGLPLFEALRSWTPAVRLSGIRWRPGDEPDARALADAYTVQMTRGLARAGVGCFSYELEDEGHALRLHFTAKPGAGALRPEKHKHRRSELLVLLARARAAHPGVRRVRGGSWLYNLPGYRALFPPAVLAEATRADTRDELEYLALWGQFLRGDHTLHQPGASAFRKLYRQAEDERSLLAAFPLPKLDWQAPVEQIEAWLTRDAKYA